MEQLLCSRQLNSRWLKLVKHSNIITAEVSPLTIHYDGGVKMMRDDSTNLKKNLVFKLDEIIENEIFLKNEVLNSASFVTFMFQN